MVALRRARPYGGLRQVRPYRGLRRVRPYRGLRPRLCLRIMDCQIPTMFKELEEVRSVERGRASLVAHQSEPQASVSNWTSN
jgi:hypothetical protein